MAAELECDLLDTVDWGRQWLVDFNAGKTQLVSFDWSNNTSTIGMKMDGSVLEEKQYFKIIGLLFSSKVDWGSYIIFIGNTVSKKIGAFIHSMKFLSPEVALYSLYIYCTVLHGILLSCLGSCSQLLLGNVRQTTKTDM